LTATGNRTIT